GSGLVRARCGAAAPAVAVPLGGDLLAPAPLHAQNVVTVILVGDQVAVDAAFHGDFAVLDGEDFVGIGLALGVNELLPAGEVLAVEELDPALLLVVGGAGERGRESRPDGQRNGEPKAATHGGSCFLPGWGYRKHSRWRAGARTAAFVGCVKRSAAALSALSDRYKIRRRPG